ncbi:MAG: hypothetical protein ACKPDI_06155, partial [Actinomycetota bacterium]
MGMPTGVGVIDQMDGHGSDKALIGTSLDGGLQRLAIERHPDRFFGCLHVDPNGGVPGPRLPLAAQHVELVDEVCWYFPELTFVMRHGGEPWVDLNVKLLLKWPNLYY